MSLLEGRTRVKVFPRVRAVDEYGEVSAVAGEPVFVDCTVQWGKPNEATDLVVSPATGVTVIGRVWAGGEGCRFEWDGCVFEQVGHTAKFYGSALTAHFEVFGRLISTEGGWSDGENVL